MASNCMRAGRRRRQSALSSQHDRVFVHDRYVSFIIGPDGQTTSLILHRSQILNGLGDLPMKRIDAETARQILNAAQRLYQPKPDWGGALIILK